MDGFLITSIKETCQNKVIYKKRLIKKVKKTNFKIRNIGPYLEFNDSNIITSRMVVILE